MGCVTENGASAVASVRSIERPCALVQLLIHPNPNKDHTICGNVTEKENQDWYSIQKNISFVENGRFPYSVMLFVMT